MVVGEDIAIIGVHYDTGARARDLLRTGVREAEEAPECLVTIRLRGQCLAHADIDDGRRCSLDERGETRDRLTIDEGRDGGFRRGTEEQHPCQHEGA